MRGVACKKPLKHLTDENEEWSKPSSDQLQRLDDNVSLKLLQPEGNTKY